jgi:hypothetical protein
MPKPFKRILAFDFETAWSRKEYTLSKLTTEEYIRDTRFKAWGCAYQYVDDLKGRPVWVSGKDLPAFFDSIDWTQTAVLAHNAQFDVSILSWRYGHVPCFIFDTLSMARALHGVEVGNSLAKLTERFGLPPKGQALHSTDGILDELPAEVENELGVYCEHDTALCIAIFDKLLPGYPTKELRLIDLTLRMYVKPVLELDRPMLEKAIAEEKEKREGLLARLKIDEKDLASNDKFADVLRSMGVDPPVKISKTTGKEAYAFAKNDALFQALVNHEREDIALLSEARLAVKSTLERTRAQRFLDVAGRGLLPVPLNYYAAHTGRWGGSKGSALNMQNLKRGSFLRDSVCAPEGFSLLVLDLAQIEPRVLAYLASDTYMLRVFASGVDPYATFGAVMFGVPGMTKESHPELRQSAKSALLGAGYGLGWAAFATQLLTGFLGAPPVLYGISFAKQLGIRAITVEGHMREDGFAERMADIPRTCSNDELAIHCTVAKRIIDLYRQRASHVVQFWQFCDGLISSCLAQDASVAKFGGAKVVKHMCVTFAGGEIGLPNGLALRYADLRAVEGETDSYGRMQWVYGPTHKKLYGGKITENIVQAVARIIMTDGMLRLQKRYPVVMTAHDEVGLLVPDGEVVEAEKWAREQMTIEPAYMAKLPLAVTSGYGKRYGDAK